ncbi:hypothetical protein HNY73_018856 [Argiope bruennichi]|uniref:Uncharacterized protein n=1 Tax=Argiope bruennichi TaxID=94029 RepID=A0A8T0EEB5_ARGBR|nr:hypothetical protein HNY73_018856 [Argiope bruennichi]
MEIKQLSPCLHSERHLIYVNEQKYGIIVENSFHGKFGEKIFQRHSKRIQLDVDLFYINHEHLEFLANTRTLQELSGIGKFAQFLVFC